MIESNIFRPGLFAGKTAFVAGGTSGINLAIARRFETLGAKVFVISRAQDKVDAAAALLGPNGAGQVADVRDYAAVEQAFSACVDRFGPIDFVVSGAAGNFLIPAADLSPNGFATVISIDLIGSFHVARAAFANLRKPGACILFISALQAFAAYSQQVHACAAKAGIDAMMRTLALEWGEHGVRVNSIAPGPIAGTEGMARLAPDPVAMALWTADIPRGQMGSTADVAELAMFLCSDAAANISGSLMVTDGASSVGRRASHG